MSELKNLDNHHALTLENAPKCYIAYTKCDHRLLLETFERIKIKQDLFIGMTDAEIEKIKNFIIPSLINDKLVEENTEGLRHLKNSIIFNTSTSDKILMVKSHYTFSRDICEKVNNNNKDDYSIFEFINKKVSKNDFDLINKKITEIKQLIISLPEENNDVTLDCEFAIMVHKEERKKEKIND